MKINFTAETTSTSWPDASTSDRHCLVVINDREARVFRSLDPGTIPEQILYNPAGEAGESDLNVVFAQVARALKNPEEILVFGSGKDSKSGMGQLVTWLVVHHSDLAKRIVRTVTVDERSLVDSQLLTKARIFYGLPCPVVATP